MTYAAPDEDDEPDDEPMFGQFAELCGVVLGFVVLGVVVLGDVVVPPPEAAQAAPPLAERATAATAATWRIRAIGYLLCRILRSNQRHLSAVAENAVSLLRSTTGQPQMDAGSQPGPTGLQFEVVAVALLFAVVGAEILVTYTRLPARELYHVSGSGLTGGLGRLLVFLNYPTALVAIGVVVLIAERLGGRAWMLVAGAAVVLSAAVFVPGVVDQADLDPKAVNVFAALGVAATAALSVVAAVRGGVQRAAWRRGDHVRVAIAATALLLAVPWLAADIGLSFNGIPVLGTLYQTAELRSQPGIPELHPAVHHGHHHGMDGVLLLLSALLLSRVLPEVGRRGLRTAATAYVALMLSYGIGELANDFWLEQIVKRGWTNWAIPDVTRPSASVAWGVIVLGAVVVYTILARRPKAPEGVAARTAVRT
jgi:hypothetical protein